MELGASESRGRTYIRVGKDELSKSGVEGVTVDSLTGGEDQVARGSVPESRDDGQRDARLERICREGKLTWCNRKRPSRIRAGEHPQGFPWIQVSAGERSRRRRPSKLQLI
jgi:hypothetical protein